jgi:hypothetical protein
MKTATMFSAIINEASQVLSVRSWIEVFIAVHVDEENQAKKVIFMLRTMLMEKVAARDNIHVLLQAQISLTLRARALK